MGSSRSIYYAYDGILLVFNILAMCVPELLSWEDLRKKKKKKIILHREYNRDTLAQMSVRF